MDETTRQQIEHLLQMHVRFPERMTDLVCEAMGAGISNEQIIAYLITAIEALEQKEPSDAA